MRLITEEIEIKKCIELMEKALISNAEYVAYCNEVLVGVAFGKGKPQKMYYLSKFNYWFCIRKLEAGERPNGSFEAGKWWTSIGVGPVQGKRVDELFELNVPLAGTSSHIQGSFIEKNSKIYFVHKGARIAGLKKEFIQKNFQGKRIGDSDRLFVGEITSNEFPSQMHTFINEIKRLKELNGLVINNI